MTRRSFLSSKRPNFEETLRVKMKVKMKVTARYEGNVRLVILTKKSHTKENMYVISCNFDTSQPDKCDAMFRAMLHGSTG